MSVRVLENPASLGMYEAKLVNRRRAELRDFKPVQPTSPVNQVADEFWKAREAVAFVVCQAIGLETGTAASDYIQLYDGNTETLAASLDRVQKTAARIIEGMHSRHVAQKAAAPA